MKKVYFVRHGQSEGNAGIFFQTPEEELTEQGLKQAEFIAQRCSKLPIECIVSSPFTRAKKTAEIIAKKVEVPLEFSELFVEKRRPSEQMGKLWVDKDALEIEKMLDDNFLTPGWKYSDEENFEDVKSRAEKALDFLAQREEKSILVVTHGYFMRMLLARAVFGSGLTAREALKFLRTFLTANTGISVLDYSGEEEPHWVLVTWNDHAHLG